jgi:hypothetical protein
MSDWEIVGRDRFCDQGLIAFPGIFLVPPGLLQTFLEKVLFFAHDSGSKVFRFAYPGNVRKNPSKRTKGELRRVLGCCIKTYQKHPADHLFKGKS